MKNFIFLSILASVSVMLPSCKKGSTAMDSPEAARSISLRPYNGVMYKSAVNGTKFPESYDLLVSAYRNPGQNAASEDAAGSYFTGIHFKKSGSVWKEAKYWPLDGTLDFLAIASAGLNTAANGIVPTVVWGEGTPSVNAGKAVVSVPDNSSKFDDLLYGALNGQSWLTDGNPLVMKHANAALAFALSTNAAYDESSNAGITIDSLTIDGAKWSGTLTVSNPGAASGSGNLSAVWSALGSEKTHVNTRIWDETNNGIIASESELKGFNVPDTVTVISDACPFGNAYAILPGQAATQFTLYYTVHNGKDDAGTALNSHLQHQYPCSGNWDSGKKYIYSVSMTLNEITISPSVTGFESGQVQ